MKRIIALGALLALVCVASVSNADVYKVWKQVGFRNQFAALGNGGIVDSAYKSHTGAVADTTQPFVLDGLAFTGYPLGADSLSLVDVALAVGNGTTLTGAGTSTAFVLQGSYDGINWDPGVSAVVLVNLNTAGFFMYKGYHTTRLGSITAAATTDLQMGVYPMYRVICTENSANKGKFQFYISYWRAGLAPNW